MASFLALWLCAPAFLAAQSTSPHEVGPEDYRVFTGAGVVASLDDILHASLAADVVFLGETHSDRVGHALKLDVLRRLLDRSRAAAVAEPASAGARPVVLSLEMFERDVQYVLDEYLAGLIGEDHFLKSSRPWLHYATDYRPLVELARERGTPVVAANAPRRYVNRVSREGPASLFALSDQAKRALPPLPWAPPSAAYRAELDALSSPHGEPPPGHPPVTSHTTRFGADAQALWDATMAWSIIQVLLRSPDALTVHVAGSFHVRNGTGIPEHLVRYRPGTRMITVLLVPAAERADLPETLEATADYVILTDAARARPLAEQLGGGAGGSR
jgi:uncharacterized iron-regulated protein